MADYIDRQDAVDALSAHKKDLLYIMDKCGVTEEVNKTIEIIRNVPSADVKPVRHGHWNWFDGVYCSVCNYKLQITGIPSYCLNCGAQMDEGSNNDNHASTI